MNRPAVVRLPCPAHGGHDMGPVEVARAFVAVACERQAAVIDDGDRLDAGRVWDDLDHLRCPLTALDDSRSGEGWDDVVDQAMCRAGLETDDDPDDRDGAADVDDVAVTGRVVAPVVEAVDVLFEYRHDLAPDVLRSLADVWMCASAARYGQPYERFWNLDPDFFTDHTVDRCEGGAEAGTEAESGDPDEDDMVGDRR